MDKNIKNKVAPIVLETKDLNISFKTDHGILKAVRGVSFELHKGETLCIVGESGSGKSVTSKAIMGILPNNAIVEAGSIIYNGENLLEISEEEFHKIRGHQIGMIFQDPLSSLNPIVRIGKQITEATLINADKLQKMYKELISEELTIYKNAIAQNQIAIKKAQTKCELRVIELKKRLESEKKTLSAVEKTKIKQEIAACRKTLLSETSKLKSDLKVKVVPLKKNLAAKKIEAKAKVKTYKNEIEEKFKKTLSDLKKNYEEKMATASETEKSSIKKDYDAKIKQEKNNYVDHLKITKKEAKIRAIEVMKEVGIPLPERRFKQYPFEFSGGMRQRIVIAIALTANPDILICDEPTTALDVTIQAQILDLITKLKKERELSCIFITHDLGVVANMADKVAVMYAGKIVEYGTAEEIFFEPKHPYTWALLSSIPDVDSKEKLEAIPGTPPDMLFPPVGDAFALRSKYALEIDFKHEPPFFKVSETHYAATWLLHPDAPRVEMPKIVSNRIKKSKGGKQHGKD